MLAMFVKNFQLKNLSDDLLQTVHAISSLLSPHPSRPEQATAVLLQRPLPQRSGQKSAARHLCH
jgi:hypothetical protein